MAASVPLVKEPGKDGSFLGFDSTDGWRYCVSQSSRSLPLLHERDARVYIDGIWGIFVVSMARLPRSGEFAILLRAGGLVCVVRAALWIVPFAKLRQVVDVLADPRPLRASRYSAEKLSWAVRAVSQYVPRATCLTQALVLHILLRREGLPSRIRIGVSKDARHFEAHAWVESQDRVVIGDTGLQRYTPMMVWD